MMVPPIRSFPVGSRLLMNRPKSPSTDAIATNARMNHNTLNMLISSSSSQKLLYALDVVS